MPIDLKEYLERLEEPEDREAVANSEYQRELFEEYVQRGDNFPSSGRSSSRTSGAGPRSQARKGYGSSSGRSTSATSGGPTSPTTS